MGGEDWLLKSYLARSAFYGGGETTVKEVEHPRLQQVGPKMVVLENRGEMGPETVISMSRPSWHGYEYSNWRDSQKLHAGQNPYESTYC